MMDHKEAIELLKEILEFIENDHSVEMVMTGNSPGDWMRNTITVIHLASQIAASASKIDVNHKGS